jgi:hypothetical protein
MHGVGRLTLTACLALAAGPHLVSAQPCATIQPGDTVARVAARVTGSALARHERWFQIVDPLTGRVVPKSRYNRIQPGWQACVATPPALPAAAPVAVQPESSHPPMFDVAAPVFADLGRLVREIDSPVFWWGTFLVVAVLIGLGIDHYLTDLRVIEDSMRHFGARFIAEFERPLRQPGFDETPLQSRLRLKPQYATVEVLLAPSGRRRYPNLTDHKHNVEYDVERVLQVVDNPRFISGRPYAEGTWIVIPFQLTNGRRQVAGR